MNLWSGVVVLLAFAFPAEAQKGPVCDYPVCLYGVQREFMREPDPVRPVRRREVPSRPDRIEPVYPWLPSPPGAGIKIDLNGRLTFGQDTQLDVGTRLFLQDLARQIALRRRK